MKKAGRDISINLVVVFVLIFILILVFPNRIKDAIVSIEAKTPKSMAIVVPHFDFAKDSRQNFINQISGTIKPDKVIIASTNHFNTGSKSMMSSDQNWTIGENDLKPELEINKQLLDQNLIDNNKNLMLSDHGVKNVINDVGPVFPDAKYLSLLVRDTTSDEELIKLSDQIKAGCEGQSCLLIASVDFSHYGPNSLAQNHDQFSLSVLNSLDFKNVKNAETDSAEVLSLLIDFAKSNNLTKFELFENNNSGETQKNDEIETTSWIIGKYIDGQPEIKRSVALTFAGDMMLDRMINHEFKDKGFAHIFDNLGNRVFWGSDISIANLEGPISKTPIDDNITADNMTFNFAPKSIDALKFLKLNTVSLANNHTSNAGASGFEDTKQILEQNKISYFGLPAGVSDASIKRFDTDYPVSVIGLDALSGFDDAKMNQLIKDEKASGRFVIIYPHWGSEYLATHTNSQSRLARLWIDNGADMIVGSHPHVVEDSEIYNGKLIVYSLGNFVFDQTFSKETQQGLILAITIDDNGVTASYLPIISKNYQPQFAKSDDRSTILNLSLPKSGYLQKVRSDTITINK
jgi:poly-gamma-glutamate synthesis protein (capsule biosynthesis protein)